MSGSAAMELRHLRYFVAVAEARSFAGAAAKLHLAQPALSRQIRDLERMLHTELFERDARGVELTPAGQACHVEALRILKDAEDALKHARLAAQGLAGRCVIGASRVQMWNGLVPQVIARVRKEFPGIELSIEEQALQKQWKALTACETDLGLGSPPERDYSQLSYETHAFDILDTVVLSRSHPLASRESLTLEDLSDDVFIHRDGVDSFRMVRAEFARRGFEPKVERKTDSLDSILMMVAAGGGWTILPRSIRQFVGRTAGVVPLTDFTVPYIHARLWRRGESRPVVRTVLSLLRRMSEELQLGAPSGAVLTPAKGSTAIPECPANRLELRHLRYFTAIVDEGSIGKAAESLGLTQPALSRQMRDLEGVVGAPLIERVSRGVVPTMAGEALHKDARQILDSADRMAGEAQRAIRTASGRCIIGVVPTPLVHQAVSRAVREALQRLPDLQISVVEVPTPRQPSAVTESEIDIGLGHTYPSPSLHQAIVKVALAHDALNTALVSASSSLARRDVVSLADLGDVPFLFMKRAFSPAFYDMVMDAFTSAGYRPRIEGEFDGLPTVWALAAKNLGWCLAPESQRAEPPPGLVALSLKDFRLPWGVHLVCRDREASPAVLAVRDLIMRAAVKPHAEA
jgi:DNA-binding transcriptional LysR family regulator